jgi:hypothetical protein
MTDQNAGTGTGFNFNGQQLRCDFSIMESIGFIILWFIITVVTLGLGSFFAVYYFYKALINKTYVLDGAGNVVGRLDCDLTLPEVIGHIVIWILITIVTFGIGLLFYVFRTLRLILSKTRIVPV